jgi:hypothetical protein
MRSLFRAILKMEEHSDLTWPMLTLVILPQRLVRNSEPWEVLYPLKVLFLKCLFSKPSQSFSYPWTEEGLRVDLI